jgi:signal transduction histidine kinase
MRSLRARLALLVGIGTFVVVGLASMLVVRQNWQRADATLTDDVIAVAEAEDRAITQLFDNGDTPRLGAPAEGDFVVSFDDVGDLIELRGEADATEVQLLADELFVSDLTSFDLIGDDASLGDSDWAVAATGCLEPQACASIMAGRPRSTLGTYVADRVAWILLLTSMSVLATSLAARWLVGRSLRPVDRMRRELDEITTTDLDRRLPLPESGDELERLGESFNATIDRLANGVEAQRRFASDAAHELRSPLAGIRATLEVAQVHPERTADAIATSVDQVDRADRLLADLLLLARSDSAPQSLHIQVTDLDDVVLAEIRQLVARHAALQIDRHDVRPVQAPVAPGHFLRIVRNLLDNAAVHSEALVKVSLGLDRPGSAAESDDWFLIVEDDGPGVPESDRERVFDRFARLDESRSRDTGGTGLGLAIVRELVSAHGGSITVSDSELGGAAFVVRAPVRAAHHEAAGPMPAIDR